MHRKDMVQMIVVILVIVVAFYAVQFYFFPKPVPPAINGSAATNAPSNTPSEPGKLTDTTPAAEKETPPTSAEEARGFRRISREEAKLHTMANSRLTAWISERGAVLERVSFVDAQGNIRFLRTPDDPRNEPDRPLSLLQPLEVAPNLASLALVLDGNDDWRNTSRWEPVVTQPEDSVVPGAMTFRFPPSTGFEHSRESDGTVIYKTIALLPDTYRFDVTIRIVNEGSQAVEKVLGLWGPISITNDGSNSAAEYTRVALYGSTESKRWLKLEDSPNVRGIKKEVDSIREDLKEEGKPVFDHVTNRQIDGVDEIDRFLVAHGLRTQYFLAFLASDADKPDGRWSGTVLPIADGKGSGATSLIAPALNVKPGSTERIRMRFYAGPRDKGSLQAAWEAGAPADTELSPQWNELATSGFFDLIASPLIWLLELLAKLLGPGLAIFALTLIVRFSLSPLSYRAQKSMATYTQKMKVVKPKLDAIKEKYEGKKDRDSQLKMLTETRMAMREQNVGLVPLGGCLPMLLQLPIFIGLYRAFGTAFFLRQAEFLWIHDLSLPDATIPGASWYIGEGWLSFLAHNGYLTINILPVLWIVLSIVQFKMQPKPDDPQQAAMQKQMGCIFPLMGLMFYGFAAGFALYFIVSSLYSMAESKLIKRYLIAKGIVPKPENKPKVKDGDKPAYHAS